MKTVQKESGKYGILQRREGGRERQLDYYIAFVGMPGSAASVCVCVLLLVTVTANALHSCSPKCHRAKRFSCRCECVDKRHGNFSTPLLPVIVEMLKRKCIKNTPSPS